MAVAGAAPVIPYLGSTISLISKAEIRYEGTLYTIDTKESNIALQNVRSFGTEGRKKTGPQIPATQDVYEYIIFRGADIKDLCVKESAEPSPAAAPPVDPAIVNQPAPASVAPPAPLGCGPCPLQPPRRSSGAQPRLIAWRGFGVMRATAVRHSATAMAIRSRPKPPDCPVLAVSASTLTPRSSRFPIDGARLSDCAGGVRVCVFLTTVRHPHRRRSTAPVAPSRRRRGAHPPRPAPVRRGGRRRAAQAALRSTPCPTRT